MEKRFDIAHHRLIAYLEKLIADQFFGMVTLSFQNGKLCNIKVERNMKLSDLPSP